MLESLWNLLAGVLGSIWALVATLLTFVWDMLTWLHFETPRLEGLLVGVLLAWLLARRESHPLLRVLSAPLKLVLDILDLAWDQVVEVSHDLWETAKAWTGGTVGWTVGSLKGLYQSLMGKLQKTKDDLEKQESEK